jgi:hypothetical protein
MGRRRQLGKAPAACAGSSAARVLSATPTPHRTETKKREADQTECGGFGDTTRSRSNKGKAPSLSVSDAPLRLVRD